MTNQTSILNDADLDIVTGGTIGAAAQRVSGLFKAASDIGKAATQALPDSVGDLISQISHHH
jgi:hypothetical protein